MLLHRARAAVLVLMVTVVVPSTIDAPAGNASEGPRIVTGTMPADPGGRSPYAWEPGLAQAPGGTLWTVGNHCPEIDQNGACNPLPPPNGLGDSTPLWRSGDGGHSWQAVADPLRHPGLPGAVPDYQGGNDSDVAVAPRARPHQQPLLYVVSLYAASSALALSADGGHNWRVAPLEGFPIQDRPWLAASGTCDLYIQYHPFVSLAGAAGVPRVDRYDGCALYDQAVADAVIAAPASTALVSPPGAEITQGTQLMGKVVARGPHIYLPHLVCVDPSATSPPCSGPTGHWVLYVATSTDRAVSFVDRELPPAPITGAQGNGLAGVWPISLAADDNGNVAVAFTGTSHLWLWTSRDAGATWARRLQPVDDGSGYVGATLPSVAVAGQRVVVAYYATPASTIGGPYPWYGVVADSSDHGRSFTSAAVPAVLATTGTPDLADQLYDNFGATITKNGRIVVVMTESCANRSQSDVECPGPGPDLAGTPATRDVIRWAVITRHP